MTSSPDTTISFVDVSKFYGEVLGINHVTLRIPPGLTGLVGPNGSGKSTLLNLLTGLIQPTAGQIHVLGLPPSRPSEFFRQVGYCTQYDGFPDGATGWSFLLDTLGLHGFGRQERKDRAWASLQQVGLGEAAKRKVAGYSKGMRQRIKLAQAICHDPQILVLDEPLNGLDPIARTEMIDLMKDLASRGHHVLVSSHILHEVDLISDQVILMHGGSVVAEGEIRAVRGEITSHPVQILIRSDNPHIIAAEAFRLDHAVEARILEEEGTLLIRTRDADAFFGSLQTVVLENNIEVETVTPAEDETVDAVYEYLIGPDGAGS